MEYGGITPIGLPPGWPVLVDAAVAKPGSAVAGSGIRGSKPWLPGRLLAALPSGRGPPRPRYLTSAPPSPPYPLTLRTPRPPPRPATAASPQPPAVPATPRPSRNPRAVAATKEI